MGDELCVRGPCQALGVVRAAGDYRGKYDLGQVVFGREPGGPCWCAATDTRVLAQLKWDAGPEAAEVPEPFGLPAATVRAALRLLELVDPTHDPGAVQFVATPESLTVTVEKPSFTATFRTSPVVRGTWPLEKLAEYESKVRAAESPLAGAHCPLASDVLGVVSGVLSAVGPEWNGGLFACRMGVAGGCWAFECREGLERVPPNLRGWLVAMPLDVSHWWKPEPAEDRP